GIVSAGEEVLKKDRVRDADGLQVLHGRAQLAGLQLVSAFEPDLAHLYARAFLDVEHDADGRGRNGMHLSADGGELASVLREDLLELDLRLLDLGGIVLIFDRETDFVFLEAVKHVTLADGVQPEVFDGPNGWLLFN